MTTAGALWVAYAIVGTFAAVVWTVVIVGVVHDRAERRRREAERRTRDLAALQQQVDHLTGELRRAESRLSARVERVDGRLSTHVAGHAGSFR